MDQPISDDSKMSMLWENGYALKHRIGMKHCTYDMQRCFEAQTLPTIESLSDNWGWANGGQTLEI